MVRTIEKKLNAQLERRTVEGFDYSIPAPHKDIEFARPPREPQRRKPQAAEKPKPAGQGAGHSGTAKSGAAGRPHLHAAKPAHPGSAPTARHSQRSPRVR
jgi:ATP-dependent RNA helicase RhlE